MKNNLLLLLFFLSTSICLAQLPNPALVGYWQNWHSPNVPYVELDEIDLTYNVVNLSFAVPQSGTTYDMKFTPYNLSSEQLISKIRTLQNRGVIVNISIGGGGTLVALNNVIERNIFITSMLNIINTYGFDGMDIDLESGSISVAKGSTIFNPVDARIINLIEATKTIMKRYQQQKGKKLILTLAPETAFVQGGQSNYGGIWGGYLPIIHALRDDIDLLHVQLYNSGSMYGINGGVYTQGTADFIVAMSEALIQGFNTSGGYFSGLSPRQIAIGLPACQRASGGGFADTTTVKEAMEYLLGKGRQPGTYTLARFGGYPTLGGMMTWSINWDEYNCYGQHSYVNNFRQIYSLFPVATIPQKPLIGDMVLHPNLTKNQVTIQLLSGDLTDSNIRIFNLIGQEMPVYIVFNNQIDVGHLAKGYYTIQVETGAEIIQKRLAVF